MEVTLEDFLASFGVSKSLKHAESEGNTTAVIVALPSELDPVRLVGSEDKHATLLYFGETSTLPEGAKDKMREVVALAAEMFSPFSERVVSVDRLGSENPPALVGKLTGRGLPKLRNTMLIVPEFNEYLGNAMQHPSYTPHVTLDYPDFEDEAKLRPMADNLRVVQFDRLALWWNDEHFEFPLRWSGETAESDAYHSTELYGKFLLHYGVRGMRWGVRKDNSTGSSSGGLIARYKQRKATSQAKEIAKKAPAGTLGQSINKDGKVVLVQKKNDGSWEETWVSKDAEAFMKSNMKGQHQMSNDELRAFLTRAKMMKEYDDLGIFKTKADHPNQELRDQVERLELNARLSKARAQLAQDRSRVAKVNRFIKTMNPAFKALGALDKFSGNNISNKLNAQMSGLLGTTKAKASTGKPYADIVAQAAKSSGVSTKTPKSSGKKTRLKVKGEDVVVSDNLTALELAQLYSTPKKE